MACLNHTIMVIFLFILSNLAPIEPSLVTHNPQTQTQTKTRAFIESSCQGTRYSDLCIRSLATFAKYSTINSPQHLAHVALSVSLSRALQTRDYLLKVAKELEEFKKNGMLYLTVEDCKDQITDSVDQISQSIKELRRMNKRTTIDDNFLWHISNVETWVSTALTEASYCAQSFPGHRMSKRTASIKVKVQNVAEVTSNALAIFHTYAAKYKAAAAAARAAKKP